MVREESLKNLIPSSRRSPEELREIGRKGGIKSGEAKRKRKAVKTAVLDAIYSKSSDNPANLVLDDLAAAIIRRVLETGDPNAFEKLMEYAGMSPDRKRKDEELILKKEMQRGRFEVSEDIEDLAPLAELLNEPDSED